MNQLAAKTKEIMNKFGVRPNKRLGQNFLIDQKVLESIVEAGHVKRQDMVIEIGPGLGVLTDELCKKASIVLAIELDRRFINILQDTLNQYENFRLIQGDVLKLDLSSLIREQNFTGEIKVVANLPYYITTPVIMKFLEEAIPLNSIVVMVQKEVAQRITASPGGKDYGALSVAVNFYGLPEVVCNVPPSSFIPQPEVDSSVIKINIAKEPRVDVNNKELFFRVVKASFSQRRKTIQNSLSNSGLFKLNKSEIKEVLNSIGIDENQRPETLSIFDFGNLANKLAQ